MDTSAAENTSTLGIGAFYALAGKFIGRGFSFLFPIVIGRLFGPDVLGMYAIIWALLRLTQVFSHLGLTGGVIRFGAKYIQGEQDKLGAVIFQSAAITLVSSSLIALIIYLLSPPLALNIYHNPDLVEPIRIASLAVPLMSLTIVMASAMRINNDVRYSVLVTELVQPVISIALLLGLIALLPAALSMVWAIVLSFAAAVLVSLWLCGRLYPGSFSASNAISHRMILKELLPYSIPIAFSNIFFQSISWSDRLFLGAFTSSYDTGIYQAAAQFVVIFNVITASFGLVLGPMFARHHNENDPAGLAGSYKTGARWAFYLCLPLLLVLAMFPGEALAVLFGVEYVVGEPALKILLLGQVLAISVGAIASLYFMTDHQKVWMRNSFIVLLMNVALHIVLTRRYGFTGAAWVVALSTISLNLINLLYIKRALDILPYDRKWIKGLGAAVISALVIYMIHTLADVRLPWAMVLVLAGAYLSFALGLVLLGLDVEDRQLLRSLTDSAWRIKA